MEITDYKSISDIVESAFTVGAIILGGVWTYFLFIKNRKNYPIIGLELSYEKIEADSSHLLVHVSVRIINKGVVLLKAEKAELRLRQVKPLPTEIINDVMKGYDPVEVGATEIPWPVVANRNWNWGENAFEIEPGESDTLHADYIIDSDIEVIEFYFYLKNNAKRKSQLGWQLTQIVSLSDMEREDGKTQEN